ncbi:rCG63155 [Rattus norvegicus]
MSVPA